MSTTSPPLKLLCALAAARKEMLPLDKNDSGNAGYDGEDHIFHFPKEEDLRAAVTLVFEKHELMEVIGDAVASAGFLATTWTLYHLPSGESITHQITWPIDGERRLSRPHSAAAAWSHAWRHFMTKLLAVRTVDRAAKGARPGASAESTAAWMAEKPIEEKRAPMSQDAQWGAVGAVVEPAPHAAPHPPPFEPEVLTVWAEICDNFRKAGTAKRWDSCLAAWKEFAGPGHEHDLLAPNDNSFKRWLVQLANQWIDEKRPSARPA